MAVTKTDRVTPTKPVAVKAKVTPIDQEGKATGPSVDAGEWVIDTTGAIDLAPPRIPTPTAVVADWFPAAVKLPDLPPVTLARAFATPQGLYVYRTVPADGELGVPLFFSPIDYGKTPRPITGYAAKNAGIPFYTDAGLVTLTPLSGCGCTARNLKHWKPAWSRNRIAWKDAAK